MLEKYLWCSCGFETMNAKAAVKHVWTWHASHAEKMNFTEFATRVRILIYTLAGALEIEHKEQ
jgi:hypothetical protein